MQIIISTPTSLWKRYTLQEWHTQENTHQPHFIFRKLLFHFSTVFKVNPHSFLSILFWILFRERSFLLWLQVSILFTFLLSGCNWICKACFLWFCNPVSWKLWSPPKGKQFRGWQSLNRAKDTFWKQRLQNFRLPQRYRNKFLLSNTQHIQKLLYWHLSLEYCNDGDLDQSYQHW